MPERIQLSRRKGWRKPENTVVVSRPSKWGNPFPIAEHGRAHAVAAFRAMVEDADARAHMGYPEPEEIRAELAGKNLACWCRLTDADGARVPCHADVLLEIANS